MPYDFYTNGQQLTAADDYDSIGDCGLADGYLRDEEFKERSTFFCNDFYEWHNGVQPAESAFKVDGENAYFSYNADQINEEAERLPAVDLRLLPGSGQRQPDHQRRRAGRDLPGPDLSAERRHLRRIPAQRRPRRPENRTDPRRPPGPDHRQPRKHRRQIPCCRSAAGERTGLQPPRQIDRIQIPRRKRIRPSRRRRNGDLPGHRNNAVYIKVTGSADGDIETGRGAIVFFQPSSPAIFNSFAERRNSFFFDNEETVPATGTATIKYAYAQAYNQAEVEALVGDAIGAAPAPPAPNPTPGGMSSSTTTQTATGYRRQGEVPDPQGHAFQVDRHAEDAGAGHRSRHAVADRQAGEERHPAGHQKGNLFLTVAPTPELRN